MGQKKESRLCCDKDSPSSMVFEVWCVSDCRLGELVYDFQFPWMLISHTYGNCFALGDQEMPTKLSIVYFKEDLVGSPMKCCGQVCPAIAPMITLRGLPDDAYLFDRHKATVWYRHGAGVNQNDCDDWYL